MLLSLSERERGLEVCNPANVDERTVAERKWQAPLMAPAAQKPCDVGLFSDEHKQGDLF